MLGSSLCVDPSARRPRRSAAAAFSAARGSLEGRSSRAHSSGSTEESRVAFVACTLHRKTFLSSPDLAGAVETLSTPTGRLLRNLLTTKWTVGAVAVILDEEVNPPEVLLVQHSYRVKGAWGLPGGSLESGLGSPREPSKEERDDIIESSLRREVFEELGIEIEIVRLIRSMRSLMFRRNRGPTVSTSTTGVFPNRDFGRCARGSAVGTSNHVRRK